MRILCDVDGVLADLVGELSAHLVAAGFAVYPEDFTSCDFAECLGDAPLSYVRDLMSSPGFCGGLPWYPAAKTFLGCLQDIGDVVALTKPYPGSQTWAAEREAWLSPLLTRVIHTAHKGLVPGHVLIEDSRQNAEEWLAMNPRGRVVLIDRPWNQGLCSKNIWRAPTIGKAVSMVYGLRDAA